MMRKLEYCCYRVVMLRCVKFVLVVLLSPKTNRVHTVRLLLKTSKEFICKTTPWTYVILMSCTWGDILECLFSHPDNIMIYWFSFVVMSQFTHFVCYTSCIPSGLWPRGCMYILPVLMLHNVYRSYGFHACTGNCCDFVTLVLYSEASLIQRSFWQEYVIVPLYV